MDLGPGMVVGFPVRVRLIIITLTNTTGYMGKVYIQADITIGATISGAARRLETNGLFRRGPSMHTPVKTILGTK